MDWIIKNFVNYIPHIFALLFFIVFLSIRNYYKTMPKTINYVSRKLTDSDLKMIKNKLQYMDDREFEIFISYLFNKMGYYSEVTPQTNDKGKDVIVYDYCGDNSKTYVECKRYSENLSVSREVIDKLIGAATMDNVQHTIVITTGRYTKQALECRQRCPWLELWYLGDLMNIIRQIDDTDIMRHLGFNREQWGVRIEY